MLRIIIPAAGKGARSGLSFPKTLQIVDGLPILVRLLDTLRRFDPCPAVIVSPSGKEQIEAAIDGHGKSAELIVQNEPRGMGHAVAQFRQSPNFCATDELLVIWGDMLSLTAELIQRCIVKFQIDRADFAFPTSKQSPCYTCVNRAPDGSVTRVLEKREFGSALPEEGEADCGIFIFRKEPLFTILQDHEAELIGPTTGEINFLPTIGALANRGYNVQAYPIACDGDSFSFNSPDDLDAFYRFRSIHRNTVGESR